MPSTHRHQDSRRSAQQAPRQRAGSSHSALSEAQLMDRQQQLRRKLSATQAVWHSGRLACLAEALQSLEEEMQRRRTGTLQ